MGHRKWTYADAVSYLMWHEEDEFHGLKYWSAFDYIRNHARKGD